MTTQWTFTPPTRNDVPTVYLDKSDGLAFRLFRHMAPRPEGVNVFLYTDGSISPHAQTDAFGQVPGTQKWDPAMPDGIIKRIYWGAHANLINATEQTALVAAGFGANIVAAN